MNNPDDKAKGGVISFDFEVDVAFGSATSIGVDSSEVSFIQVVDTRRQWIGTTPLRALGYNTVQTIFPMLNRVRQSELHLGGSGALDPLCYCPERWIQ